MYTQGFYIYPMFILKNVLPKVLEFNEQSRYNVFTKVDVLEYGTLLNRLCYSSWGVN